MNSRQSNMSQPPGTTFLGTHTVLYIEDNLIAVRLMEEIVDLIAGLTMISSHDAITGLKLAEETHPDIVICDIRLPDVDGYEALARLRVMESTRETPVLALSANASPDDVKKATEAGFDAYLTKSIDIGQTVDTIRTAIDNVPDNVIDFAKYRSKGA